MSMRLLFLTSMSLWVAFVAVGGCAGSPAGRGSMEATVEPLTEAEFDAFATDVAEQIITWLERGQVSLPVTIRPPTVGRESVECAGVAKAFSQRLAAGLSDRLLGAVRFGRTSSAGPRLRCGISFMDKESDEPARTVEFRLWDADSNLEICRGSYEYQRRPENLIALRRQVEERRLAARTPRGESEPSTSTRAAPVDEPIAATVEPARPEAVASAAALPKPEAEGVQSAEPVAAAGQVVAAPVAAAPVETARFESGDRAPAAEPVTTVVGADVARTGIGDGGLAAGEPAATAAGPAATPKVAPSPEVAEKMRLAERRRMPRRRTVRIDGHEHGLAELVQEQAVYFRDRTMNDELGRLIFLDRQAWENMRVETERVQRTHDGHLSIQLLVQADGRPLEADVRVIYLDVNGRQVEVSPVRTYQFSPSYAKHIALHSSEGGAAEYIVLVSRG